MKKETLFFLLALALYAIAHLAVTRNSVVAPDESGYTDPGASWALGQGFTSGAWYAQNDDEFFAGNVPLHEMLQGLWFRVFGFGITQSRGINVLYVVLGVFVFWDLLRRMNWIVSPTLRVGSLLFFLFGATGVALIQCGRPDAITFLLAAFGVWSALIPSNRCVRCLALVVVGFFSVWAGLQLVIW